MIMNIITEMDILIVDKHTKTIYGQNKEKLLKVPIDTLLGNIFNDLWIDIIKYTYRHPFMIGKANSEYREISLEEFNDQYKTKFIEYYTKNEGLFSFSIIPTDGLHYLTVGEKHTIGRDLKLILKNKNKYGITYRSNEITDLALDKLRPIEITNYQPHFHFHCLSIPSVSNIL
jgi:hypothetical protein